MSRAPPLMPSSSSGHSYSSPKLGAAAIYSTSSPTGSPRPYFAQHLPGTLSPYRDASARYAHLGSPRISSLSRDATAALKGSNYPTSSSRPTSPTPGSRSPSPSSDSGESSASSSRASRAPADDQAQLDDRPLLTRSDSSSRKGVPPQPADIDDSAPGPSVDSPSGLRRVHQLQPIETKSKFSLPSPTLLVSHLSPFFLSIAFDILDHLSTSIDPLREYRSVTSTCNSSGWRGHAADAVWSSVLSPGPYGACIRTQLPVGSHATSL
ncbi:uncharacterized protein UTRI_03918 [Ustilago trichophora]|uniref:Uncharacterized protein n=1 Tax=Ustilago trichophora TaxID=86804 RepID=A0A5C3EAW0_9BASI|nr:uncharacterized protein UTRI_03918 [Ustilago trichophora]